jgi:hypothetical protein
MGIHACAPKGTDCPALALRGSDARESDPTDAVQRMGPGSYQLAGRVSTEKRASVYRTDQLSEDLKLGGNGVLGDPVQCRFLPRASEVVAIDLATLRQ